MQAAIGDRLFSAITGAPFANYVSPDGAYPSAFSPDGALWGFALPSNKALVTCLSDDPNATLYNMMLTDPYTPFKILYHPDGVRIGCVDRDNGVQMYDMDQDLPVGLYHFDSGQVYDAALSNDGSLLLMGGANVVKLYEVATGRVLRYFYPMHSGLQDVAVRSVQFARNDSQVITAWSYNYIEVYERSQAAKLDLTPATRTLNPGQSQAFQVEVAYDDTTRRDVTPRPGQDDTSVSLEIIPAGKATVKNNIATVATGATGSFTVRARYREDGQTLVGEALVTIGTARLLSLQPNPDKMALIPGVFRPITYSASYDDGYTGNSFLQFTLNQDARVVVAVDSRMTKLPAWLSTWAALPATLASTDAVPARRLYQHYFPAGTVTLGANRDTNGATGMRMYDVIITNPDLGQTGTVVIATNPAGGKWHLEGPLGLAMDGTGPVTLNGKPTGNYTVTWLPLANWAVPLQPQVATYLARNAAVTFSGQFIRHTGTVSIRTLPPGAPWQLTDADGKVTKGQGGQDVLNVPTGGATLQWMPLAGYDTPNPAAQTQTLTRGAQLAFTGIYLAQNDSVATNQARIIQCLLGLIPAETWWMDANSDGKITIADAVYIREHATPEYPVLKTPVYGATAVDPAITFAWTGGKYTNAFEVYIWKQSESQPATPSATVAGTVQQYKPSQPLAGATWYNWLVKARNQFNASTSNYGSFQTK